MKAVGRVEDLVSGLSQEQSEARTSDLLNGMVAAGEAAAQRHEWTSLLKAAVALIDLEEKGGPGAANRAYGIALRRMLPRSVLEHLAKLATSGPYKADAITVLRRMGADGTEILLGLLSQAPNVSDRRGYFNALMQMTEGTNLMVHMLGHDEWFVVRNIAELCGELKLEEAIPELAKRVSHSDERVRRAVAGALGKIGGPGTIEALRTALKDQSPAVRLQAAMGVDGRKTRGLAMTLAVAAEEEHKADVQREMFLALGRIASPEALQALSKAAEPGGRFFKRKPTAVRLAAIEGLHLAGPSAANALKTLLEDEEKEVRESAEKSLATLWE
jgi:HEAT repeat protein